MKCLQCIAFHVRLFLEVAIKMPKTANSTANPFVNGFRLDREAYGFYQRIAEEERRTLADVIRLALEDRAKELQGRQTEKAA